jgi:hypothetical protein
MAMAMTAATNAAIRSAVPSTSETGWLLSTRHQANHVPAELSITYAAVPARGSRVLVTVRPGCAPHLHAQTAPGRCPAGPASSCGRSSFPGMTALTPHVDR